jgi:CRP-like cAMP-binding protein
MLSLLAVRRDGKAIETATVGREGVVGAMAGLGLYKSLVRVVVQMPMACSRIAATHFRTVVTASDAVLLSQARMTAACNALHPMEGAFAAGCCKARIASDIVALTQEFLAEMLGVRRTSITEVASKVQNAGIITCSRGMIRILDRPALPRMSCECYETLLDQSAALA